MADLHSALEGLSPISYADIPTEDSQLKKYLQDTFSRGQLLIDSVPQPPTALAVQSGRPRSDTGASIASNASEMSPSMARAEALVPAHAALQKEWGKPLKLSAKENPMGIGVYKLSGKDGRAWFARRSVHEGMPYHKWKQALKSEFPESLEVQGAPGEGNIRGIGAEKRVEKKAKEGIGCLEVYHLSAQFPGPTAPRDFVELLLTSSAALSKPSSGDNSLESAEDRKAAAFDGVPRHFMVISKPCKHPDCPPRSGFVRGEYESIEFIREIPNRSKRSSSTTDLTKMRQQYGNGVPIKQNAILRHARQKSGSFEASRSGGNDVQSTMDEKSNGPFSPTSPEHVDGRARGKTISFAESRGRTAKGEALDLQSDESDDDTAEMNPVEWIMITRSDPGGSVPRFMVERGTPSSIVADASKFLNWACKKQLSDSPEEVLQADDSETTKSGDIGNIDNCHSDGHIPHLDGTADRVDASSQVLRENEPFKGAEEASAPSAGILSNITNAASTTFEAYGPQSILDRLPAQQRPLSPPLSLQNSATTPNTKTPDSDSESTFSSATFASADSHLSSPSIRSTPLSATSSATKSNQPVSPRDKEIAKMAASKAKLDEKLRKTRAKETKDKQELTSKEEARLKKAEEKHAREVRKVEERFEKEMRSLEEKRRKEEEKERKRREAEVEKERKKREAEEEVERKRKEKEEKESVEKVREVMKEQLEALKKEMNLLEDRAGKLQSENTALVAALGKMEGGEAVLEAVRKEMG
ncbi:hypothetical protein MMC26_003569 [Xylographa opegraphella]|nr:hypothetical protein [Xylographa opegraphella]